MGQKTFGNRSWLYGEGPAAENKILKIKSSWLDVSRIVLMQSHTFWKTLFWTLWLYNCSGSLWLSLLAVLPRCEMNNYYTFSNSECHNHQLSFRTVDFYFIAIEDKDTTMLNFVAYSWIQSDWDLSDSGYYYSWQIWICLIFIMFQKFLWNFQITSVNPLSVDMKFSE